MSVSIEIDAPGCYGGFADVPGMPGPVDVEHNSFSSTAGSGKRRVRAHEGQIAFARISGISDKLQQLSTSLAVDDAVGSLHSACLIFAPAATTPSASLQPTMAAIGGTRILLDVIDMLWRAH